MRGLAGQPWGTPEWRLKGSLMTPLTLIVRVGGALWLYMVEMIFRILGPNPKASVAWCRKSQADRAAKAAHEAAASSASDSCY